MDEQSKLAKNIVVTKILEFARKRILEEEIQKGAKFGVEKFEAVTKDFFANAKKFIADCKKTDNELIPNELEEFGEELISDLVDQVEANVNLKTIVEGILGQEKKVLDI
nr:MAG TPA: hypothetical protein [Caudoviricetes sp.]